MFYGTAQNILNANIKACTPAHRSAINKLLFDVLRTSGISSEHTIISRDGAGLHKMAISNTIAVVVIAPWAFRRVLHVELKDPARCDSDQQELLLFSLYIFRALYTETFFLPRLQRDGLPALQSMNGQREYYDRLKGLCVKYIELVDQLCGMDEVLRGELDKPNIHRLLELYHHSIPRFGHVCLFDELRFEATNQPLKRALS